MLELNLKRQGIRTLAIRRIAINTRNNASAVPLIFTVERAWLAALTIRPCDLPRPITSKVRPLIRLWNIFIKCCEFLVLSFGFFPPLAMAEANFRRIHET